jgi:hypothetical protein
MDRFRESDAQQEDGCSSSHTAVAMMESSNHRLSHDATALWRFHFPRPGRIVVESLVRSSGVIVVKIVFENSQQVDLIEHEHVVEALASDRADQPLDVRILPVSCLRRNWNFPSRALA